MRIFTLLFALCLCLALTVFFLGDGNGEFDPGIPAHADEAPQSFSEQTAQQVGDFTQNTAGREAVADTSSSPLPSGLSALALSGRVIDSQGRAIASAEVALYVQESLAEIAGAFGGRDRGRTERGRSERERFAQIRAALSQRRELEVATTKTDSEGRFAFRKPAFPASTLQVAVTHHNFAPKVVREQWKKAAGDVELEDIVLAAGGTVRGIVVDQDERPIGDAQVSFAQSDDRGRGRRGGRSRGGSRLLAQLIDSVRTDASGNFELRHIPPGRLEVKADAERFLPSASRSIRLEDDEIAEDTVIHLTMGTPLSGRVMNIAGLPIEGALVAVRISRSAQRERSVAARKQAGKQAGKQNTKEKRTDRTRGKPSDRTGNRTSSRSGRTERLQTETDQEGRFSFDAVPFQGITLEVTHDQFIPEERDPLVAEQNSVIEVAMQDRISARGLIVDAVTGQPIEVFGIAARKIASSDEASPGFGRRSDERGRGRGGRSQRGFGDVSSDERISLFRERAKNNPKLAEKLAEVEARQQASKDKKAQQDIYWQNLLGQSGMVAGKTPAPSQHPQGEFELKDLLPGRYVFDIDSPNHVRVAAGIVELQAGVPAPALTFRLEPGRDIAGRVINASEQTPIEKARVELYLPKMAELPRAQSSQSLRDLFRRGENLGKRVANGRTDSKGRFELPPQKAGRYVLRVQAEDYLTFVETEFVVSLESRLDDLILPLDTGARVYGRITDLKEGASATVELTHTDGKTYSGRVDREMGIYSIQGLPAGGYFVRVSTGRDRGGRGNRGGGRDGGRGGDRGGDQLTNKLAVAQGRQPHLHVRENQKLRYDTTIEPSDLGRIHGTVMLNGEPASGFEVQLKPRTEEKANRQDRALSQIVSRLFQARTDREGRFEIDNILPGSYLMSVQKGRGRGGRGGRSNSEGAMHAEPIEVIGGIAVEPSIHIQLGGLKIELRDKDSDAGSGTAATKAQVSIVRAADVDASSPKTWKRASSFQKLKARSGTVEVSDLPIGPYLFSISGRGVKSQTGDLQVTAGPPSTVVITIETQTDQDIINTLDKDGDGALSVDELPGKLKSQFAAADKDGNGKVSLTEFTEARAAQQAQRQADKAAKPPKQGKKRGK